MTKQSTNKKPVETPNKVQKSKSVLLALIGWGIIYTAIVFGIGALVGNNYSDNRAKQVHSQVETLANSVKK